MNIILSSDSYKHSHFKQYPEGAKYISSYIEARGDGQNKVQFFGIQAFIQQYLATPITQTDIDEAEAIITPHGLPFNREGWEYILTRHSGYLPLEIKAVPEGMLVQTGIPVVQIRNTDPNVPWLTSYIETPLLRSIWYMTAVATLSFCTKVVIYDGMLQTSDNPTAGLPFKLHDFGARGVSSSESAQLGGMAHLVNFSGTDTVEALVAVRRVYDDPNTIAGFSIPASEHSTMTSWGRENEAGAYANMIDQFGDGMFSVVSDSYDLFNAVENILGGELRDKILNINGKFVVRPDSGDPVETPIRTLEILWDRFGGTTNSKGFRVLNPKIGVIQGDGMNFETVGRLVLRLIEDKWSLDNIAFGMGGRLLQGHMRDDMSFAMKANAINYGGAWQDLQKKPSTDPTKASKAGRQVVILTPNGLTSIREDEATPEQIRADQLHVVYRSDQPVLKRSFQEVRDRAMLELVRAHRELSSLEEAA